MGMLNSSGTGVLEYHFEQYRIKMACDGNFPRSIGAGDSG
jgi:hypothetical protein